MPWTHARLDSKCVHNCDEKLCGCVGWRLGSRSNLRLLRCTNHYASSIGRQSALCPLSLYRRRESERQRGCPQVSDVRLRIYTLSASVGDGCWAPLSMVREVCAGCRVVASCVTRLWLLVRVSIQITTKLMWVFGCTLRYKLPQAVRLSGGWVRSRFEPLPISLRGRGSVWYSAHIHDT